MSFRQMIASALGGIFINSDERFRNGWWILAFFLLLGALVVGTTLALPEKDLPLSAGVQAVLVLLVTGLCLLARRESASTLLGTASNWYRGVPLGLLLAAAVWGAVATTAWLAGAVEWQPGVEAGQALLLGAVDCLLVAVLEELVFRGFVFQRLVDGLGVWMAQPLMAAYFVLTHSQGLAEAGQLQLLAGANIFVAGLVFGAAYLATRSLALPIALHFGLNFLQGPVLGFGVSGNQSASAWVPQLDPGMPLWHGGAFGLEASVPGLLAITALLAGLLAALLAARRHAR